MSLNRTMLSDITFSVELVILESIFAVLALSSAVDVSIFSSMSDTCFRIVTAIFGCVIVVVTGSCTFSINEHRVSWIYVFICDNYQRILEMCGFNMYFEILCYRFFPIIISVRSCVFLKSQMCYMCGTILRISKQNWRNVLGLTPNRNNAALSHISSGNYLFGLIYTCTVCPIHEQNHFFVTAQDRTQRQSGYAQSSYDHTSFGSFYISRIGIIYWSYRSNFDSGIHRKSIGFNFK